MNFSFYPNFKHLNQYNNMYLYSDTHFGDEETQAKRHITDEQQIANINSKVGRKDVLIILGDVGTNAPFKSEYVRTCIKQLRGYKILVLGNHDQGASTYEDLFDEVYTGMVFLNDKILLSHEPLKELIGGNLLKHVVNIHGHDHACSHEPKNSINVCAEAIDFKPVSLLTMLKEGKFAHVQSIHRETIDKATDKKKKRLNRGK